MPAERLFRIGPETLAQGGLAEPREDNAS